MHMNSPENLKLQRMNIKRKPEWLRISRQNIGDYAKVSSLLKENCLHTICQSGMCPNQHECWARGTATFMILGDVCTRSCKFCATKTGRPLPPDPKEPEHLADSVEIMKLRHVVITSVDRDDLPDKGAQHWADCIAAVRKRCPQATIEVLLPDFDAQADLVNIVLAENPDIVSHNVETVERITPLVRSRATYRGSLKALELMHSQGHKTKTGIMLGLGETDEEILQTMDDALAAGVSIFTMGQYLQPSRNNYPVADYITPEHFEELKQIGLKKGFAYVESGPLVRSSYHAEEALAR